MDRHLKERLIGAAALMAVASFLILEMLSGPGSRREQSENAQVTADGSPIKTYTIDLRQREQANQSNAVMPPPELPLPETPPPEAAAVAQPKPDAPVETKPEQKPEPQVQSPPSAERPAEKQPEREEVKSAPKPDTKPSASATGGWAVQVASLDNRAAAEKIVDELKRGGYSAFVMTVEVKGKTMYRVRVGPAATRPAADALLAKVKRTHAGATVMRHP